MTLSDEIQDFVAHWFPLADPDEAAGVYDESFVHTIQGQMAAHLSILYRVLVSVVPMGRDASALHVGLLCNAVVLPQWRGNGLMHPLYEQAHERMKKMGFPFSISIARWPEREARYGYKPAPNLHKEAMVLELGDVSWPKGKVRLTEGDKWE